MDSIFVAGPPVSGDLFYGREELLDSIKPGNNYALVGIRRVGKSSIVYELTSRFEKQKITPVIISLFEITPFTVENFLKRYTLAVTRAHLKDSNISSKIEAFLAGQKEGVGEFLKNTKISVSLNDMVTLWLEQNNKQTIDYTNAIEKTIMLPDKLSKESGKHFIIFLDEFQQIKDLGILNALRENMQRTKNVSYVVCGSSVGLMKEILGSRKSPFYGFFIQKQIKGLDEKSAEKLLQRAGKSGVKIEDEVIRQVIKKTRCYPLYLQTFGHVAVDFATFKKIKKVEGKHFEECWNRLFQELYFHFEYLESELTGNKKNIAQAIATNGPSSITEISKNTGTPLNELSTYLKRLLAEGILEKADSKYQFADPVFAEWLYQKRKQTN